MTGGRTYKADQQEGPRSVRVACRRCRTQKVRCSFKDSIGSGCCFRCQKANVHCVPDDTPPPHRNKTIQKPKYDAELRIRHLEEALMETQNAISAIQPGQPQPKPSRQYSFPDVKNPMPQNGEIGYSLNRLPPTPAMMRINGNSFVNLPTPPSTANSPKYEENPFERLLTSGVLTLHQAHGFFNHFQNLLLPMCPHVCFETVPFAEMRRDNPLKLHAIMSAVLNTTAGTEEISLEEGLRSHLADRLHVAMDHDTGMIESLLITQLWSAPSDERRLIAHRVTVFNICHSLCVVNATNGEPSQMVHIFRLYLSVFIMLGAICLSLVRQPPMLPWSAALQHAYDEVLHNYDKQSDLQILLSARNIRLEQDVRAAFAAVGPNPDFGTVEELVISFDAQIEEMRSDLFTNRLLVFAYYTMKFNLHDRAVHSLAKGTDLYVKCVERVMSALCTTVEYFISCKPVLDTFPTYVFYKPTKAIMSMFKYSACDLLPEHLHVDAPKYIYQLEECLLSAPKTPSVKRTIPIARMLRNRFCNNDEFPPRSMMRKFWEADVVDANENHRPVDDWTDFMLSLNIQESDINFWNKVGLY